MRFWTTAILVLAGCSKFDGNPNPPADAGVVAIADASAADGGTDHDGGSVAACARTSLCGGPAVSLAFDPNVPPHTTDGAEATYVAAADGCSGTISFKDTLGTGSRGSYFVAAIPGFDAASPPKGIRLSARIALQIVAPTSMHFGCAIVLPSGGAPNTSSFEIDDTGHYAVDSVGNSPQTHEFSTIVPPAGSTFELRMNLSELKDQLISTSATIDDDNRPDAPAKIQPSGITGAEVHCGLLEKSSVGTVSLTISDVEVELCSQ